MLLWPLLVYEIYTTTVGAIEAKINKFTRRWLRVLLGLTDMAKMKLPLKSIWKNINVAKPDYSLC